ncbi:hypothetical protein L596_003980 [Steinernema carpocapsae]|uniref:Uncharacterized protein n=1 Tax=Steinernema carpocapsae TaxID=34508 RepID=A0A4U8UVV1_STECR|nr:hypothetical protein L596_003980 [Steinernema carpocapsae]
MQGGRGNQQIKKDSCAQHRPNEKAREERATTSDSTASHPRMSVVSTMYTAPKQTTSFFNANHAFQNVKTAMIHDRTELLRCPRSPSQTDRHPDLRRGARGIP